MITTAWAYLAAMLLAAGLFPTIERGLPLRLFRVLPPIVLTYLFVTALAAGGLFGPTDEVRAAQRALTAQLLPALLFLLMATCDLRAIFKLGPRVLATFACAMASILLAIVLTFLAFRGLLPAEGWKMLAALSATWTGGSANLVAVKQVVGLSEASLPAVLLADALCYSVWVALLFSSAGLAPAFDRFTRADRRPPPEIAAPPAAGPAEPGTSLLWLGLALAVGLGAAALAATMPASAFLTSTSWTALFATGAGLVVARTPLARLPGPAPLASALLAGLVAVLASQGSFAGLASAPLFVLCGFCVLALHLALMVAAARLFRLDLYLCGIASLAQIGGPASAPLLAAAYSRALVPVAVLLAMLGLVLGTGVGLSMARLLSALAPAGAT
ncbi:MAG TPA: DUF819 family protein [Polyangiaceae bacterium]|nr:DUF819 family protein [Polyangiaceae bacterium]